MLPVKGNYTITAVFGQSGAYWANGHKGIDFVADDKTVYSVGEGTVRVVAYDADGWGNYISVGDEDGRRHLYCHLERTLVSVGDKVTAGDKLGVMGKTGNATGVHLHYQINNASGTAQNPAVYLGIENKTGTFSARTLFKDDNKISSWAKNAVYEAKEKGILLGDADGNFRPKDALTREEMAVILQKLK